MKFIRQFFKKIKLIFLRIREDYFGDERTVDTHIKSIRAKMKEAGLFYNPIQTVWGIGYKFLETEEEK